MHPLAAANRGVTERVEEFCAHAGGLSFRSADALHALRGPSIVDHGDIHVGEVSPGVWRALACLAERELETDVRVGSLNPIEMQDGVHHPLPGLAAVAARFIVSSVVHPYLADVPACKAQDPRQRLSPTLLLLHVAGDEGHYVIKRDEVDAADAFDHLIDEGLPLGGV